MVSHESMNKVYCTDADLERFKTIKKILEAKDDTSYNGPQVFTKILDDFIIFNELKLSNKKATKKEK